MRGCAFMGSSLNGGFVGTRRARFSQSSCPIRFVRVLSTP